MAKRFCQAKTWIPVLHLSQLLGLAFGLDKEKLGLEAHQVKANL
jgi:heterodisulfide reductase subunit B